MSPRCVTTRGSASGFTLLELLVALSLLGLVFAALGGSLRFGSEAWRKGSAYLAETDELTLVHRVLRRQISAALPADGRGSDLSFEGKPVGLGFLAPAPSQGMPPGLYRINLRLTKDGDAQALVLAWQALGSGDAGREPLLRNVRSMSLEYLGDADTPGAQAWSSNWEPVPGSLPRAVRVRLTLAGDRRTSWPALVFPIPARPE